MTYDFSLFNQKSQATLDHVNTDIATLRTGKASAQLLDPVKVIAYGSEMKVNELANISTPDPNLIIIKPWDRSVIESIEKAIASSGLNLSPVVDNDIIRIAIPQLTEERRLEMVKLLQKKIEGGKVMLRNIRSDIKKEIEDQEGESNISEDDIRRDLEKLNTLTQEYIEQLEAIEAKKEQELLTV